MLARNELPGHLAALVCGGTDVGQALVKSPRVNLVSFTGSEKTGRKVGVDVASRFGQTILELGGNNAMVVMDDADQKLALRTALFACVGTAGQRCTSTRRLLLHSSIAEDFLGKLKEAYAQVKVGHPLDEGVLCGPSVSFLWGMSVVTSLNSVDASESTPRWPSPILSLLFKIVASKAAKSSVVVSMFASKAICRVLRDRCAGSGNVTGLPSELEGGCKSTASAQGVA